MKTDRIHYTPIGITGSKEVGKDTVADFLIEQDNLYVKYSMATPIRAIMKIFYFNEDDGKDSIHPIWGISWRQAAQIIGTDLFRKHFRTDTWIIFAKTKILSDSTHKTIIPDIRFNNEAKLIKEHGGIIIKVIGPNRKGNEVKDEHSSEKGIDEKYVDFVIENTGSLLQLKQEILKIEWRI